MASEETPAATAADTAPESPARVVFRAADPARRASDESQPRDLAAITRWSLGYNNTVR